MGVQRTRSWFFICRFFFSSAVFTSNLVSASELWQKASAHTHTSYIKVVHSHLNCKINIFANRMWCEKRLDLHFGNTKKRSTFHTCTTYTYARLDHDFCFMIASFSHLWNTFFFLLLSLARSVCCVLKSQRPLVCNTLYDGVIVRCLFHT